MTRASTPVVAVVLAGGAPSDALARAGRVAAKSLVALRDKPLGAYVLEALRDSRRVGRVIYVGPTDARLDGLYHHRLPPGLRLVDSLALGLGAALALAEGALDEGALDEGARVLVLSADIPWVTGAMIDRFVTEAPMAALVYPAIPEAAARAQFPGQSRTFVRLSQGRFTAGNLVLIEATIVPRLLPFADSVYRARKNPPALAALVGADVALSLLTGRLSFEAIERRVGRLLEAEVRIHVSTDAALGADVDKPEHLTAVPDLTRRGA